MESDQTNFRVNSSRRGNLSNIPIETNGARRIIPVAVYTSLELDGLFYENFFPINFDTLSYQISSFALASY